MTKHKIIVEHVFSIAKRNDGFEIQNIKRLMESEVFKAKKGHEAQLGQLMSSIIDEMAKNGNAEGSCKKNTIHGLQLCSAF